MMFRKAVLIIHGFAGGTYDEEALANYLELNKYFDVFQFTLPGHEKNLSKACYEDWIKASEEKVCWLSKNGYKNIYVIGHSMGGVIATYLAGKYSCIKKLVLAAPSFQYLDVINEKLNFKHSLKMAPKVVKTYGTDEILSRMLKLNLSTIRQFMLLVKKYYDTPKEVIIPTLIIQGKSDNLVPLSSSEYVYDNICTNNKTLIFYSDVTHDVFRSKKDSEIFYKVSKFLKNGLDKGVYNYD
ncbi:MAG: alpha/beta fold hydrolase [bacterium]|nr:alpha/beta fold hydrolase [bacterium]